MYKASSGRYCERYRKIRSRGECKLEKPSRTFTGSSHRCNVAPPPHLQPYPAQSTPETNADGADLPQSALLVVGSFSGDRGGVVERGEHDVWPVENAKFGRRLLEVTFTASLKQAEVGDARSKVPRMEEWNCIRRYRCFGSRNLAAMFRTESVVRRSAGSVTLRHCGVHRGSGGRCARRGTDEPPDAASRWRWSRSGSSSHSRRDAAARPSRAARMVCPPRFQNLLKVGVTVTEIDVESSLGSCIWFDKWLPQTYAVERLEDRGRLCAAKLKSMFGGRLQSGSRSLRRLIQVLRCGGPDLPHRTPRKLFLQTSSSARPRRCLERSERRVRRSRPPQTSLGSS
ncbi:hypothetical protein B0H16DRAFT_234581 [Mycena metata]|uniref:Uncharacterized protein n=1 Tax=Mycena metata TaxID=1033252 RepID=A0AAD7JT99_9AGAR|nr:hypothetical protein B0H16DRAFT_234581 [Mycena metata]